jgi:coproporphyrinogen III oxidase-like Fe-S oxidoreductase
MPEGISSAPAFDKPLLALLRREYGRSVRCDPTDLHDLPPRPKRPCQLYVHVPFCESLCPYCSFHRVQFRLPKAQAYFEAVRREIRLYAERGYQFTDVYIGGGTPTVLPQELARTLELIRSLWPIRWVSVETNPNHLNPETLERLSDAGIDRLSVGVQSFDDDLLRQMGRYQHYGSAAQTAERLAAVRGRFPTLNVDMMFNFPTQTLESVGRDIDTIHLLGVEQVSFYPLMRFTSTERNIRKRLGRAGVERRYAFYQQILRGMRPVYQPSSAWCFSRVAPQDVARPIDEYITQASDYVGVGSGAFSYLDGALYATSFSLRNYREAIAAGKPAITRCNVLTPRQRMRYDFLVGLFGLTLPYAHIQAKYGAQFWWRLAPELAAMGLIGALRYDPDAIRLTDRGMYCWMLMMAEFFTAVDRVRDTMRLHIREERSQPSMLSVTPPPADSDPDRFRSGQFSQRTS